MLDVNRNLHFVSALPCQQLPIPVIAAPGETSTGIDENIRLGSSIEIAMEQSHRSPSMLRLALSLKIPQLKEILIVSLCLPYASTSTVNLYATRRAARAGANPWFSDEKRAGAVILQREPCFLCREKHRLQDKSSQHG
jgi:hypothetical protein